MKKYIITALLAAFTMTASAQDDSTKVSGTHIEYVQKKRTTDPYANCEKTKYTTTINGNELPIYVTSKNRRAFVILLSKKGTYYRKYLGEEMTQRVNQK